MPIPPSAAASIRLCKHADYQRVYKAGRKQFAKQISYFFSLRDQSTPENIPGRLPIEGPRVGLTVGKPLGKAVDRNRIKRRLRDVVRRNAFLLEGSVDVILHPRRSVKDLEFKTLEREVVGIFRSVQRSIAFGKAQKTGLINPPAQS